MSASRPFPASLQAVEWAQVVDDVGPVEEPKQPGTALSCKDWSGQEMCCVRFTIHCDELKALRTWHPVLPRTNGPCSSGKKRWRPSPFSGISARALNNQKNHDAYPHISKVKSWFFTTYIHISYSISLRASLNLKHQTSPWKSWSGASVAFSCTTELSRRFTSKTSASLLRDPQRSAAGHAVCRIELHGGPPAATSISMNQSGHWAIGNQPSISLNCTAIWHVVERRILAHLHADVFSTPACEFIPKDSQTKEWSSNIALCRVFLFKSWSFWFFSGLHICHTCSCHSGCSVRNWFRGKDGPAIHALSCKKGAIQEGTGAQEGTSKRGRKRRKRQMAERERKELLHHQPNAVACGTTSATLTSSECLQKYMRMLDAKRQRNAGHEKKGPLWTTQNGWLFPNFIWMSYRLVQNSLYVEVQGHLLQDA